MLRQLLPCTIVYMALHIADKEVSDLMTQYSRVTGMSKTEALRRLLQEALLRQSMNSDLQDFDTVARQLIERNKHLNLPPVSKEEMDSIFE